MQSCPKQGLVKPLAIFYLVCNVSTGLEERLLSSVEGRGPIYCVFGWSRGAAAHAPLDQARSAAACMTSNALVV